jgi:ribose transport system substrate-binding protein
MNNRCSGIAATFGLALTGIVATFTGALADDVVSKARSAVSMLSGPQTQWLGPTAGPKLLAGKHIAYVSANENNPIEHGWGVAIQDVAKDVGWKVTVIDGQGSPVTWIQSLNQAIALGVDGIVLSADGKSLKAQIEAANAKGIPVVGLHATGTPGPAPEVGIFYNISQDARAIGVAQADWMIAHSDGKARVIIAANCEFAVACVKANGVKDTLAECPDCKLLEFNNTPYAEGAQRYPSLVTAWVQKYGLPLYIVASGDGDLEFQISALRQAGVDPSKVVMVGADGTASAYGHIRAKNQYQLVTVPEPHGQEAYQAIDEINRALNKQPPSGYVPAVYLVTTDNVDAEGGSESQFTPTNDFAKHYRSYWTP